MKWQALKTVLRDVGCLAIGFSGIVYQQWTGQVEPLLLAAYMAMIGLPGTLGLVQLGRGRQTTGSTPSPPSSPPSSPSPPST